ncbi:MAG: monovalent cation/H(+) antiporter subunit G [Caldilineaceae bacterium]|nr:monovalent cation/H(+) antiporter subunit G [Caldilineaceae bacterium]
MDLTLHEGIVLFLAAFGTLFMIVSSIGVLRLPDVLARMHALGKAATLGISGLLLSLGIFFYAESGIFLRVILLVIMFFITAPIATTTMARAAYRTRTKDSLVLLIDEMEPEKQDDALNQFIPSPAESRTT